MDYPELNDWKATSWALHQAAMLVGPIHNAVFAPRNNYLHLPLFITPAGLVSQQLPKGGLIHIDFKKSAVVYQRGHGDPLQLSLRDHTQASLLDALLVALRQDELADFFGDASGDKLAATLMDTLHADDSRTEFLHLEDIARTEPLQLNMQTASDFADLLYAAFTGIARFRARLTGHMTPIVVWPEHFDLSTLWFHPDNPGMEDSKPHMNYGFKPYTPDQFEYPYFYAYVYPYPEPFDPPGLPQPAYWHTEGWRGVVVNYEQLQQQSDPAGFFETLCADLFPILRGLLEGK